MMALRTTFPMVLDARAAVSRAEELVEAAGLLLADAVADGVEEVEVGECLRVYRQAKAQQTLAIAICDGTELDWYRDHRAVSA